MTILQFALNRLIDILLIFLIIYLAGILKKKFGRSISDYFLQAAGIAVKKTEQISLKSPEKIESADKKKMALLTAKEILHHQKVRITSNTDEKILDDIIESKVYDLNSGKKV